MSYSIVIGEKVPNREEGANTKFRVDWLELDSAPTCDAPTGQSNQRMPAYSAWSDFVKETGLSGLFFDKKKGLMRAHPGCVGLTSAHLKTLQKAKRVYLKGSVRHTGNLTNYNVERLNWLEWWMRWALKNCKHPAIYNS
jgi:hypothetical protein